MEFISNYSPIGDIGLCILCLVILISLRESFVHASMNFRVFCWGIVLIMLAAVANVAFYRVCMGGEPMVVRMLLRAAYRLCMIGVLECYIIYFYKMLLLEDRRILIWTAVINTLLFALDVIEPIVGVVAYDSPFSLAFFLSYLMSISLCSYLMCKFSSSIIRQLRRTLSLTEVICIIVIMAEYSERHNSFMTFTFLLPVLVVMFMTHSNPYNFKTGALNLDSFDEYLENNDSESTYYMCLKFIATEEFKIPDKLGQVLKNFWHGYFRKAVLFNPLPEFLVLAVPDKMEEHVIIDRMERMLVHILPRHYKEFQIDYKIIVFNDVAFCNSFLEFNKMFDFFAENMEINSYKFCQKADMDELHRSHAILAQLQDIYDKYDLDDERVLVYCQPIINTSLKIYDTAEALMRLRLPDEGFIYPNEFVPLIEKYNLVHRFSMIILNKVCKKLTELSDYKVSRISVNFSVYELRSSDFVKDFMKIVSDNLVSYTKIGVEFTESTDIDDFDVLKRVIEQLHSLGCSIYLDDFGTGYSNFERLLGLRMDVVKFDRSLVVLAADDIKVKYLLKSFSDAFMKMKFKVLYEGVETNEQEELCVDSNADYLQGYKYAKPIPIDELRGYLEKKTG